MAKELPSPKDRTLFVINFDERTTEDILYELFLQSGPIESIVRKLDRNGQLIALVTYKNVESVDYAIRLFNDLYLFGQRLKVHLSQMTQSNGTRDSPKDNRGRSFDNIQQQQQQHQGNPFNSPILMENNFNGQHRHRSLHESHKRSFKQSNSYHSQNTYEDNHSRSRSPKYKKRR